ncbi:MAG: hypothetical protein M1814_003896 [Vezdaea aestivalis]|nr:MAG: hypothetical protein M1814_003896 [Vezdaea aestivalis]
MDCMRDTFDEGIVLQGRYQTISPLNHGSFGMVFTAKHLGTGEMVAIKCLTKKTGCPSNFSVDDKSEELACHTALTSHPNVVNLIESFESDAHVYLVLELCPNGDLYEAIRQSKGPLETEHVRDFMLQLVDAVGFMHSKGLYHRDIKPENIFLTQSGTLKLGDFGLATTQPWTFESTVGSDRYMSPEQYDPAGVGYAPENADIWAIGICLLNILFSRNPFATPTVSDPLFSDFVQDPQSLFDVFPTMSQDAFEVLMQCMTLDPTKRSLKGVRDAIVRAISFTTVNDPLDDFCTDDIEVVQPTANREPLRTPSITSPQIDQGGSFPWARALHMSPQQPLRALSIIHDTESYTEDLFPESFVSKSDWCEVLPSNASVTSALDSGLGTSLKSLRKAEETAKYNLSSPMLITNSVPLPSMASVFGNKSEVVSKSWSDLWDEEEAEHEQAPEPLDPPAEISRSWSHKTDEDVTVRRLALSDRPSSSVNTSTPRLADLAIHDSGPTGIGIDGVNENDGFFFEEHHAQASSPPRYSPPARRNIADKWAALGDRRRAYVTRKTSTPELGTFISSTTASFKRRDNNGVFGGLGATLARNWDRDHRKDKPIATSRHWSRNSNGRRADDLVADFEWVGGWHDFHL